MSILNSLTQLQISLDIGDILTICITIIGFALTYKALKKEYKLAIINQKNINAATEMEELLNDACKFMIEIFKLSINEHNNSDKNICEFNQLREKITKLIIFYGSLNSVKIWSHIEYNFVSMRNKGGFSFINEDEKIYYILSTLLILISQIKYDLYEIKMPPQFILLTLFGNFADTDTDTFKNVLKYNHEIVKKLNLDKFLLIEDTDYWN